MGESHQYHVTMVITMEQENAIKLLFEEKNWSCWLQVLTDETVADIIDSGFTNVFPVVTGGQDGGIDGPVSEVVDEEMEANSGSDSSDTIQMETTITSENEEAEILAETEYSTNDKSVRKQRRTRSSRRSANNTETELSEESETKRITSAKRTLRRNRKRTSTNGQEHHHSAQLQCIDCFLKFPSKEDLWKHRNEAKHPLPTGNIPTKYNLEVYSLEEHKQIGFIKCDGCDAYFLGKRRQMKHFYVVHRDLMPTPTCPICCEEFSSHAELLKHKREEGHRDSLSSLNNYQCDLCGKHMTSYSNFVQHKQFVCGIGEKEMEKIRIHACDICGKLFKSPRHVRRHKKMSHFKVPEMCDVCGTVCQGRKALDVHKKRHDERNKKHACDDCGKAFFSDSKLQEHIRTHTKEKPFKCPLCSYRCAVKPNVHKHASNVHKQSVVPIDLRRTPGSVENKPVSNACADTEPNRNISVTTQNSLECKTIPRIPAENDLKNTHENASVNVENKHIPSTYVNSGLFRNIQGTTHINLAKKHVPNAYIDYELNRNIHSQTESNYENETVPVTYVDSVLNSNIQGKLQASLVSSNVPVAYTDSELSGNMERKPQTSLENETIPNMYTPNELNRSIQGLCHTTQTPYNVPLQAGVEYNSYPYQCHSQTFES